MGQQKVYTHIDGRKIRFSFRYSPRASVAGHFEQREYDGEITWQYRQSPGLSHQPTQEWLYKNSPQWRE